MAARGDRLEALVLTGLFLGLRPGELRHSTASLLSAAGVPLEHIADVLGHVDIRTTSAVYRQHVVNSIGAEASAPMESLFGAT